MRGIVNSMRGSIISMRGSVDSMRQRQLYRRQQSHLESEWEGGGQAAAADVEAGDHKRR